MELTEAELRRLYVDEGKSTAEIGRMYDLHYSTVSRRLTAMGVPQRAWARRSDTPLEVRDRFHRELARLYKQQHKATVAIEKTVLEAREAGVPWPVIADALHLSPQRLANIYSAKNRNNAKRKEQPSTEKPS